MANHSPTAKESGPNPRSTVSLEPSSLLCHPGIGVLRPRKWLHMFATKPITETYPRICLHTAVKFCASSSSKSLSVFWRAPEPATSFSSTCWKGGLEFCLWETNLQVPGAFWQLMWDSVSLSRSPSLSSLCLSKDYPGHRSFEYETNILSCLFCQSTKYMYSCDTESLICITKNEAVR